MIIRDYNTIDYQSCLKKMQQFTRQRQNNSKDELWIVQHPSIFTYGIKDSSAHLLKNPNNITVIKSDRGGQITYHGLGQLIIYCLLDIKRRKMTIKTLIFLLEKAIIDLLSQYKIKASRKSDRPGVYVKNDKIAALAFRIRNGKTYHGLSVNVNMDLTPFSYINPCGYLQKSTQIKDLLAKQAPSVAEVAAQLTQLLVKNLNHSLL